MYYRQAELLLKILPLVDAEGIFALKGGTAINFFVRDLPRLSVDIDLAYIRAGERNESLQHITVSLNNISVKIMKMFPNARIVKKAIGDTSNLHGMVVGVNGVTIKIEPNIVIRGTVYDPETFELSPKLKNCSSCIFPSSRYPFQNYTPAKYVQPLTGSIREIYLTSTCFNKIKKLMKKCEKPSSFIS
jgi:hypothetical protein